MEVSLFKRLLYLRGSYYIKRTVDCINSVTIPSHSGFTTYMDNIGEIENKGFELDVRVNFIRTKDWNLTLLANLAHNRNKIVKIAESLKAYNDKVDAFLVIQLIPIPKWRQRAIKNIRKVYRKMQFGR